MNDFWKDIRFKMFQSGSKLGWIIVLNIVVFLLPFAFGLKNEYLALPASLSQLQTRWWTVITYMFVHNGFFELLFNMLWLYWLGQIFEEYLGNKRTLPLYLLSGLVGAIVFIAIKIILPASSISGILGIAVIAGAPACLTAIVVATATAMPDHQLRLLLIGQVKLKWLAVFFVGIGFLNAYATKSGSIPINLTGALIGFIYIKQLKRGIDWLKPFKRLLSPRPKVHVATSISADKWRVAPLPPLQDEIDRILDKINALGVKSLSKQEKETLSRVSKNDR